MKSFQEKKEYIPFKILFLRTNIMLLNLSLKTKFKLDVVTMILNAVSVIFSY